MWLLVGRTVMRHRLAAKPDGQLRGGRGIANWWNKMTATRTESGVHAQPREQQAAASSKQAFSDDCGEATPATAASGKYHRPTNGEKLRTEDALTSTPAHVSRRVNTFSSSSQDDAHSPTTTSHDRERHRVAHTGRAGRDSKDVASSSSSGSSMRFAITKDEKRDDWLADAVAQTEQEVDAAEDRPKDARKSEWLNKNVVAALYGPQALHDQPIKRPPQRTNNAINEEESKKAPAATTREATSQSQHRFGTTDSGPLFASAANASSSRNRLRANTTTNPVRQGSAVAVATSERGTMESRSSRSAGGNTAVGSSSVRNSPVRAGEEGGRMKMGENRRSTTGSATDDNGGAGFSPSRQQQRGRGFVTDEHAHTSDYGGGTVAARPNSPRTASSSLSNYSNRIELTGLVTSKPQLRRTITDARVATLKLMTRTRKFSDYDQGDSLVDVQHHSVFAFGPCADAVLHSVRKEYVGEFSYL